MIQSKLKVISEAPESNAGDDFHVLWASRKALEVLNAGRTNLKCITVEGPTPKEAEAVDQTGDKLLSIDLAEYYGGESLDEAKSVIFSQLKYSTRRSTVQYTLSNIADGNKSIIAKLSKTFKGYIDKFGREAVLQKLKIKLVTNRPVSSDLVKLIEKIQTYLENQPNSINKAVLEKSFSTEKNDIGRLHKYSSLSSSEFVDFLRLLDFSDCGSDSRFYQKQHLIEAIGSYDSYDVMNLYNGLYMLIKDKMLPESRDKNTVFLEDILTVFGKSKIEDLFPVSQKISVPLQIVKREQLNDIAKLLLDPNKNFFCLHGGAGIGKSTIAKSIQNYLPEQSVTITYDCYGQGTYFDESAIRHTHDNAITQLCNELAVEVGSPFLLTKNIQKYDYVIEFKKRLITAYEILKAAYPNALLTIIIDAADNSVYAAKSKNEPCFVQSLGTLQELPPDCKIVFTARSGRVTELDLPESTALFPIRPFELDETKEFLSFSFPDASEEEFLEFHELTHQTPRVQAYSIHGRTSLEEVFEFLKPFGESMTTIIDTHIEAAKKCLVDKNSIDKILRALIFLPRPIPISIIAFIADLPVATIHDFCLDLWSGILLQEELISFRDEDFENHLREKYPSDPNHYSQIAEFLLARVGSNEYACAQIGQILFHAKKFDQLQQMVLESSNLDIIQDPIRKREVFIKRSRLALQSSFNDQDNLTFFKLLLLSAEAAKTNRNRLSIINDNVDLIAKFTEPSRIPKLFFEITSNVHLGASNLKCAEIYSRNKATHIYAKRYIRQFESWLEMIRILPSEEKREYQIPLEDIARGAEAIYRIDGYQSAVDWLRSWKPRKNLLSTLVHIADDLLSQSSNDEIQHLTTQLSRIDAKIIFVVKAFHKGISIKIDNDHCVKTLMRLVSIKHEFSPEFKDYVISYCECLAKNVKYHEHIKTILTGLKIELINRSPSFYNSTLQNESLIAFDLILRVKCLVGKLEEKVPIFADLIPIKRQGVEKKQPNLNDTKILDEQINELENVYAKILPLYIYITEVICQREDLNYSQLIKDVANKITSDSSFRYTRHDSNGFYQFAAFKLINTLAFHQSKTGIANSLVEILKIHGFTYIDLKFTLAQELANFTDTQSISLQVLSETELQFKNSNISATERIEHYVRSAQIAAMVDNDEGAVYFQKALDATDKLDRDAIDQIKALHQISKNLSSDSLSSIIPNIVQYIEYVHTVLSDDDHFPWFASLSVIENIDFNSSIRVRCRWDHKDYIQLIDFWIELLKHAIQKKVIDPLQSLALKQINAFDYDNLDFLDYLLEYNSNNNDPFVTHLLKILDQDVRVLSPLDQRSSQVQKAIELLIKHKLDKRPESKKILELSDFLIFDRNKKDHTNDVHKNDSDQSIENQNLKELVNESDYTSTHDIEKAILQLNENRSNSYRLVNDFLNSLIEKCPIKDHIAHLNALSRINTKYLSFYKLERALTACFNAWGYRQVVVNWKRSNFKYLVQKFLASDEEKDYFSVYTLQQIANLCCATETELADVIKSYLTENIDQFSTESIYQSTEILRLILSEDQSAEIIKWCSIRWRNFMNDTDEFNFSNEKLNGNPFTYAIRYYLAHPYKNKRWDAVHVLRHLAKLGDREIIDQLIQIRNCEDNFGFSNEGFPFYWLSCKLWLFHGLHKIVDEHPNIIASQSQVFYDEATNKTNSILIRYYSKSICLKLASSSKGIFSDQEIKTLSKILIPRKSKNKNFNLIPLADGHESRFDFDELDTVPYWYDHLGRLFGISGRQIAQKAENIICDIWKYTGNPNKDNHLNISSRDYGLISKRHHSIPSVENIQTYYEYHSMMYVANELLENLTIDTDYWNTLEEWIDGWLPSSNNWLSDVRMGTPSEKQYWEFSNDPNNSISWLYSISLDDFNDKVFTKNNTEEEWVVVASYYQRKYWKNHETISISSALVNPERANSLLVSLQSCGNSHDYGLPEEKEERERFEIDEFGFLLKGWLRTTSNEKKSEEDLDLRNKTLNNVKVILGKSFNTWFKNNRHSEDLNSHVEFQNWSDIDDRSDRNSGFGTKGYRLLIKKETLLSYLSETNYNLILECEIQRSPETRDVGYINPSVKLFLIN